MDDCDGDDDDDDDDDKICEFSKLSGTSRTIRHMKTHSREFNRKNHSKIEPYN
jgi:hypothetical protein